MFGFERGQSYAMVGLLDFSPSLHYTVVEPDKDAKQQIHHRADAPLKELDSCRDSCESNSLPGAKTAETNSSCIIRRLSKGTGIGLSPIPNADTVTVPF